MNRRFFAKLFVSFSILLLALVSQGVSSVYAINTAAPTQITSNEPVYKSPTLLCGQTGSNGQQLTASQCSQQIKKAAGVQWSHIILVAIVFLAIIIIAAMLISRRKKKLTNDMPINQPAVGSNDINTSSHTASFPTQTSSTPTQSVVLKSNQDTSPPKTPNL